MYIRYSGINIHVNTLINDPNSSKSLFMLHGFSGSSDDWSDIAPNINTDYNIYLVDLPGHGKSDSPNEISFYTASSITGQIKEVIKNFKSNHNVIAGYSMGGRAALSFAVKNSALLKGLILESSTAGIKEAEFREERIAKDETLADFIEEKNIEEFVDYWMNLDIFKTQRRFLQNKQQEIKNLKLKNNRNGLANSLRGFGTGRMPQLFDDLKYLDIKTLLISGELDTKFTEINSEMSKILPKAEHSVIKNAGHNTHLEEPAEFISVLNKFLKQL